MRNIRGYHYLSRINNGRDDGRATFQFASGCNTPRYATMSVFMGSILFETQESVKRDNRGEGCRALVFCRAE